MMILTKYEHACFSVEHQEKILVVDPGKFTTDLGSLKNVVAILITHQHADHFDSDKVGMLLSQNPTATIFAHQSVVSQITHHSNTKSVTSGESVSIQGFNISFNGGDHAGIHPDIPVIPNLGVHINNTIYYPGDSFALPLQPVDTLALPVTAPWLSISQSIDYLINISPRFAFPTHDDIASDTGKLVIDTIIAPFAQNAGIDYKRLSKEINV